MAEKIIPKFELPVVTISLTQWIIGCETSEQLKVARSYSENILTRDYGTAAGATIFRLLELCDKRAEYLKFKQPEPHEIPTFSR